jgi:hypothetical protein
MYRLAEETLVACRLVALYQTAAEVAVVAVLKSQAAAGAVANHLLATELARSMVLALVRLKAPLG